MALYQPSQVVTQATAEDGRFMALYQPSQVVTKATAGDGRFMVLINSHR